MQLWWLLRSPADPEYWTEERTDKRELFTSNSRQLGDFRRIKAPRRRKAEGREKGAEAVEKRSREEELRQYSGPEEEELKQKGRCG
jgi:hypothetical protein